MKLTKAELNDWLSGMASMMMNEEEPEPKDYAPFIQEPELCMLIIELLRDLEDNADEFTMQYYSACIFALDICVAQLQSAREHGSKGADKVMYHLMDAIAHALRQGKQSLSFWLPILNAFYEVHVELSPALRDAYLDLAENEEQPYAEEEVHHLDSIRAMLQELDDLSEFEIAENFFAQSYAMPPDFFMDLLADLYSIDEGHEVGLLMLLHPNAEVRDVVVSTLDQLFESITLSSKALSRLAVIKYWYDVSYHALFDKWMRQQRFKGVVFLQDDATPSPKVFLKASEVDGSGAQGLFIHIKQNRTNRMCGMLVKASVGIKDAWLTPAMSASDVERYLSTAFDGTVTLREIDEAYLTTMVNHFLAVTLSQHLMPDLYVLEIQELLRLPFKPQAIDVSQCMKDIAVSISPFTQDTISESLKRSQTWTTEKQFTESWFIESVDVDKQVNRFSGIIEGSRVCDIEAAMQAVFDGIFEKQRPYWQFHFLWMALWLKAKPKKNEKTWTDCFLIAYAIEQGYPLQDIPIFREICRQTVINSIETMSDRRTHLA